ncbi:glucose-methanol-choline oxidoreductase [Colletotrichum incanum]|nr:glucose-methanol-choline oxidoreductase [Colletotrichum incanum]
MRKDILTPTALFREALKKAWVSKGEILNDEIYDGEMHGLATLVSSIYKGTRSSSWLFLEGKKNVTVLGQTNSRRLVVENGRAVGVDVIGPDGENLTVRAKYEVVVASGVYESPKLLMLSGIGPREHLSSFGIETIIDSPHVGQNQLDHPIMPRVLKLKDSYGLDQHLLRSGPEKDGAVSSYRWKHKGPLSSGLLELIGLPRIDDRLKSCQGYTEYLEENGGVDPFGPGGQPHFEIDFVPMFCDAFQGNIPTPPQGDYFTVIGMKDIIESDYPWPMPRNSDEAMIKMILERSQTGFHPCGTTRMSQIVDASVIPVIPDCRVHNAVYMIAEKTSDMIKAPYPELY